jgi:type II secretory pathway component PulF
VSAPSTFEYVAVDAAGRRCRGREDGAGADVVSSALEERGLLVLEVRPVRFAPARYGRMRRERQAVLELTRALAALLQSGAPLARALAAAGAIAGGETGRIAEDVRSRVVDGEPLSAALARHSRMFAPVHVGIVRAGERAGDLAGAFTLLAAHLEREDQLRSRLLSASLYPLVLASAGSVALAVLLLFVLPRFVDLLQETRSTLPGTTSLLLGLSSVLRGSWPVLVALVAAAALALFLATRSPHGRMAISRAIVRLPVVGALRRQVLAARFARLTSVLLGGGAPLLEALGQAAESSSDPLAREEVARVRDRVREGSTLAAAIAQGTLFPPLLARLVAIGEDSGRQREFVERAATLAEERTERSLQRLVTLAEPVMIVVFGGIVAFVALALLQAIYSVDPGAVR